MSTNEIIEVINNLPVSERILIIEQTLKGIRGIEESLLMHEAADEMLDEYKNNRELTEFTNIDFDNFYEAR